MRRRLSSTVAGMAAVGVLGAVFLMYTRPTFMVAMIDQLWACF
ncbi:MAG: hypothetical protein ACRYGA_01020 [Janthinobacterium lividum]